MCIRKPALAGMFAVLLLAGCAGLSAAIARFEERAAPVIAQACAAFHQAEASPLVQIGLNLGTGAINVATGLPVGIAVAAIKDFGDRFCAEGPPVGDATTPVQQAGWLAGVTQQLLDAARAVAAAAK